MPNEKPEGMKRLLKLKPAAEYLSVSTRYLRRLVQSGEMEVIRMGDKAGPWLLDVRDLDQWIERMKTRL